MADQITGLRQAQAARLDAMRASLGTRLLAIYDATIAADDLDAAFQVFTEEAVPLIEAGQASASELAAAYLRAIFEVQAGRTVEPAATPEDIVGTTSAGAPLAMGMAAFAAMVKGEIGKGRTTGEALAFGQYLATRFADAEVVSTVDRVSESIAKRTTEVTGWRGIVKSGACEPCRTQNEGFHGRDEHLYRHAHCGCSREYQVG